MPASRSTALDALRGFAMLWMTVFHFCFDLNWMGWWHNAMLSDPFWTLQRTGILSLFLFCAGLGQALAVHDAARERGHSRYGRRFWHRWTQVAGCALCVSVGSWWMLGERFIYFGVLHGLACMLLLARPLAALEARVLWCISVLCLALAAVAPGLHALWPALTRFNSPIWSIWGFISIKPLTEDYVPVLPWLGVLLAGLASGQWVLRHRPHWLTLDAPALKPVAGLGRWSLSYYMLHQPVLLGLLMLVRA
jgi:uncharacterized membrane protein